MCYISNDLRQHDLDTCLPSTLSCVTTAQNNTTAAEPPMQKTSTALRIDRIKTCPCVDLKADVAVPAPSSRSLQLVDGKERPSTNTLPLPERRFPFRFCDDINLVEYAGKCLSTQKFHSTVITQSKPHGHIGETRRTPATTQNAFEIDRLCQCFRPGASCPPSLSQGPVDTFTRRNQFRRFASQRLLNAIRVHAERFL